MVHYLVNLTFQCYYRRTLLVIGETQYLVLSDIVAIAESALNHSWNYISYQERKLGNFFVVCLSNAKKIKELFHPT